MKTGLESLDTGAPEITYSGNEGPKSPQQMQEMQQMQMAQLEEEYDAYVDDMLEQGLEPMSMQQFLEQIAAEAQMSSNEEGIGSMMENPREMAADGGVMQLVKNNKDGSRPGYRGDDAARSERAAEKAGYGGTSRADPGPGAGYGDGPSSSDRDTNTREDKSPQATGYDTTPTKATAMDVKEQYAVGTPVKKDEYLPYAQEIIGGTTYDVIPNDPANALVRQRANESVAAERQRQFNEMRRRELEEQRRRLALMNQGGGGGGQNPYYGDDEDDDEDDDDNAFPDIPTNFVDLSGTSSYTNPAFENEFFYGTPTITLANGGRANYAGGGIADLRQGYFLGKLVKSITKPFKKAFRGFKKIAKSPMGKMALLALGGYYMGGGSMLGGKSMFGGQGFGTSKLANLFTSKGTALKNFLSPDSIGGDKVFPKLMNKNNVVKLAKNTVDPSGNFLTKSLGFMKDNPLATIYGTSLFSGLYTDYVNNKRQDETMADYQKRLEIERGNFADIPVGPVFAANGGRMGFADGGDDDDDDESFRQKALGALYSMKRPQFSMGGGAGMPPVTMMSEGQDVQSFGDDESTGMPQATPTMANQMPMRPPMMDPRMQNQMMMAQRGNPMMNRGMMSMQQPRIMAQEGGMMDMGGMEKDYRNEGGFVPIGEYERKDDVPARLSKNEFVFTADAVRNAGGGDIDRGAEIMENMMENLEQGGKVSKASQGLSGAREMFATQQRLGEVL
jgi:hypothetical protein